mgnify:CR=1 FL=1
MRTLLEEFWYGNVNPQEQSTEGNRGIKNLLNLMGKNRDNLSATLTEEQKENLAKMERQKVKKMKQKSKKFTKNCKHLK